MGPEIMLWPFWKTGETQKGTLSKDLSHKKSISGSASRELDYISFKGCCNKVPMNWGAEMR